MAFRYKITVEGTKIREYYEFDQPLDEETVRQIWLSDVEQKWGAVMVSGIAENTNIKRLTDETPTELK